MRANCTYRHINTLDIDAECIKVTYRGPKYIKARLRLFNRHNGIFYETKVFKIMKDQLKNWKFV